jgi:hypothetical protein
MSRWILVILCAVLGLLMLVCGLLVPAHLRAVDASVLQQTGRGTPSLIEVGLARVKEENLGAAQLLLLAAQAAHLPQQDKLGLVVEELAAQKPGLRVWGCSESDFFGRLLESNPAVTKWKPGQPALQSEPFTEFMVRTGNRQQAVALLPASTSPAVQELLRCRMLTNTILLPSSSSSAGQAFDTAICIAGLLLNENHLSPGLSNSVLSLATQANRGGNSQPIEQMLLDFLSLGQRLNWGQLVAFVGRIDDAETLRLHASLVRKTDSQLPALFAGAQLSGEPAAVARYLMHFSQSGFKDLTASLQYGAGGVNELLRRNLRLESSDFQERVTAYPVAAGYFSLAVNCARRMPGPTIAFKWLCYLAAGFLLAMAAHFARPAVSTLELPLQVRGFHVAREILFALGFMAVVVLLSEPFLSQDSQKVEFPFRLHLPMVGSTVAAIKTSAQSKIMDTTNFLTALLFFVLQSLLYVASLVKLAEIRRQKVPPRMKLKLLENEDHLFDAGLYLGFLGTIVSLILVSLNVLKSTSLMAAYSSTSFGILFVVVFKILHLRRARRQLLLAAEMEPAVRATSAGQSPLAAPL